MTDCRFSRLLAKLEIPLLLAVPAVMAATLLAGVEQAALAMLVVVALVLALFFAGYEASRPGLRQIMPTLVLAALAAAELPDPEGICDKYPHELSGGMRQRAMIAIALACGPKLLIADEPTTALDVTIQAQIIDLMKDLQRETGTAIILITHDLGVVAGIAQRVCVMYSGKIVERGTARDIFHSPRHPYTWALLNAVPRLDLQNKQELTTIEGTPPDLLKPPEGCPFCTRCKFCMPVCRQAMPPETDFGGGHMAGCWLHDSRAPRVDAPLQRKEA